MTEKSVFYLYYQAGTFCYQCTNLTEGLRGLFIILSNTWMPWVFYSEKNHNFVSLTFPVAMPRLMMCAQATLQAPGLLPSAPVMKQFQQGQGWMVACSRGGQYHDENLGKNRQPLVSVD